MSRSSCRSRRSSNADADQAPVVGSFLAVTMMLVFLALGVLTRTAPQLNLFAVGFSVTLATGLAMLSLASPFLVPAMEHAVMRGLALLLR